jgi:hypothetical protein
MIPNQSETIRPFFEQMVAQTQAREMLWTKSNPTTFIWEKDSPFIDWLDPLARITLTAS